MTHPSEIDLMDRDYLIALEIAVKNRADAVINDDWKRMYMRLADAVITAEAFLGRIWANRKTTTI